jgi:hypothetical protein
MAKDINPPTDGNQPPDPDDARADFWEATFFNPDGTEIATQEADPKPVPLAEPPQNPVAARPASRGIGDDKVLQERIDREALETVETQAEDLGEALHAKFMHLLNERMEKTGGHLTPEDVEEMGEEFRENLADIKTAFLNAVESYTLARERTRVEKARNHLFTRLMVRKFEHRLRDERTLRDNPEFLSRRMLPGFSTMLSMMFGKPRLASYEKRIKAVAERLKNENGGHLDWDELYRSPEIKKLTLRAEIEIAQNFRNVDKRFQWMVAMINSNLIPANDHWMGVEWSFNEDAAQKLLSSLFSDLRAALKNPNARERFGQSLGDETLEVLDTAATRFH